MANYVKIVEQAHQAIEEGRMDDAAAYLDEDFVFDHKAAPQKLSKEETTEMMETIREAFPDWSFNVRDISQEGDEVRVKTKITATHEGDLDLSFLGLPVVEATGKRIELPEEEEIWSFRGDKAIRETIPAVEGGGFDGLFEQLDVDVEQ